LLLVSRVLQWQAKLSLLAVVDVPEVLLTSEPAQVTMTSGLLFQLAVALAVLAQVKCLLLRLTLEMIVEVFLFLPAHQRRDRAAWCRCRHNLPSVAKLVRWRCR
jgi:hypothetical protein